MLGHIVYSATYRGLSFSNSSGRTYLLMNGQAVDRSSFPYLSSLIPLGAYGSTSTKIVIPDMRNKYFRGIDIGRGADPARDSRTSISGSIPAGQTIGSYQAASMATHVHTNGTVVKTGPGPDSLSSRPGGAEYYNKSSTSGLLDNTTIVNLSGNANESLDVGSVTYYAYMCAS